MGRIIIYPYKMGSQSAKALQGELKQMVGHTTKVLRVRPNGNYRKRSNDLIINWGSSMQPVWGTPTINQYAAISSASNKLHTFNAIDDELLPTWTTDQALATEWVNSGQKVFARTILSGHSGNGIVVCTDSIVHAPLYTLAFDKTREYRVHVWQGEILDVQEKRKRSGTGSRSDCDVWNHGNDFVFAREGIELPTSVEQAAIKAVHQLGLDFGAVDIGYNHRNASLAVFEVNTAPGLVGTTLSKYAQKVIEHHAAT